jgi:hypothetical protein
MPAARADHKFRFYHGRSLQIGAIVVKQPGEIDHAVEISLQEFARGRPS